MSSWVVFNDPKSFSTLESWLSRSSFSFFRESSVDPKSTESGAAASRSWELRTSFSFCSIWHTSCASWYDVSRCSTSVLSLSFSMVLNSAVDSTSARRSWLTSNWFCNSLFSWLSFSEVNFKLVRSLRRSWTSFSRLLLDDWRFSITLVLFSVSFCVVSYSCCCWVSFLWCFTTSVFRFSILNFASWSWLSSCALFLISLCNLRSLVVNLFLYMLISCCSWFFAVWLVW